MGRIHLLSPETYRLIAAGEVIDRPSSALRELLDNAIDAGASDILVEIEGGGTELISVADDGSGMDRHDLELSVLEHATSKINTADDLLKATTLGFRGEALASMAAVASMEILTRSSSSESGFKLVSDPGVEASIRPAPARKGTTVRIKNIFSDFPARKQFLKRASTEAAYCRQSFVERACAHSSIAFSWKSGGESRRLPASSLEERIALLFPDIPARILARFDAQIEGASFSVVYADPSFHRRDRKYLNIFVNGRKVPEWSLSSAIEFAFADYLPGGMKPCAFLFGVIDPALADFNIHPAKREVRIRTIESMKSKLHAAFKSHLRERLGSGPSNLAPSILMPDLLGAELRRPAASSPSAGAFGRPDSRGDGIGMAPAEARAFWEKLAYAKDADSSWSSGAADAHSENPAASERFRYLGRAFGPYLVFQSGESLFVLDQHAAHERILYDRLKNGTFDSQPLLVPFVMEKPEGGAHAEEALQSLRSMGFSVEESAGTVVVEAVPAFLGQRAFAALAEILGHEPDGAGLHGEGGERMSLADRTAATIACRAAVKDGDILDDQAARRLIAESLELEFKRCPHGRPIWVELARLDLDRMVGRVER